MTRRLVFLIAPLVLLGCSDKRDPGQWPVSRVQLADDAGAMAVADDSAALTYRRYCVGCHGDDGRANGGTTGADFTGASSPLAKSDAELLISVRDGKLGKRATMPPHKPVLSDAQIAAVIAHVRARFGKH
ncbi:MAG: cytochrome c [Polyangiales bacterium]